MKELQEKVTFLEHQVQAKNNDLAKMESMFKEYATWRQKLEVIEAKMKQEVEYWKNQASKSNDENIKLQKELLTISKEQMKKASQIASLEQEATALKGELAKQGKDLETVEEALCPQCKNSMEESIVVQKDIVI